jgi:predicted transcriptional regulator
VEEDLIVGRITETEFVIRSRRSVAARPESTEPDRRPGRFEHRTKSTKNSTKNAGSRFKDLSAFVRLSAAGLTKAELAVWIAVFNFSQGGTAIVTQVKLAKFAGTTERTIKRAVASLVKRGLLEVIERGRPGRSSVYRYHAVRKED